MNIRKWASVLRVAIVLPSIVLLSIVLLSMASFVPARAVAGQPEVADIVALKAPSSIEFKIITNNGFVAYTAGAAWSVIAAQSRLPVAAMAFQILNPADAGTPDSTNLAISLYDLGSEKGRDAFARSPKKWGETDPSAETIGPWLVFRQEMRQGSTDYTVLDAQQSDIADVAVNVRLAWPHLPKNAATYDADMEAVFRRFIASVYGGNGPYSPKEGEVVRRPAK